MSLYLFSWIIICMLSIKDFIVRTSRKLRNIEFFILMFFLFLMLALRFGQGSDYFAYQYIYNSMSSESIDTSNYKSIHSEYGYLFLCNLFRIIDLPFEAFIAFTALLEMYCLYRFAKKFKLDTPCILLWIYPTMYMTYFVSAIRQGIVISIFLGILLPLLFEKKHIKYFFVSCLCLSIHTVSVVLFVIPFIVRIKRISLMQSFCFFSWVLGIALLIPSVNKLIVNLGISGISYYMKEGAEVLFLPICERIFFVTLISLFYMKIYKANKITGLYQKMYLIYLFSMAIFGLFIGYNNIASRLAGTIRFVELYLVIITIRQMRIDNKVAFISLFIVIESIMFVKNIYSYIDQGGYMESISLFSYKYVSIFDSEEIYKIRRINNSLLIE